MIKLCQNCGKPFSTNKNNRDIFCCDECESQFKKNIPFYAYNSKERKLILNIKKHQY